MALTKLVFFFQVVFYLSILTWKVVFYLKSPISIVQRAYLPKNGVEFRQKSNGDNRSGVATSYDLMRRRQKYLQSNDGAKNEVVFRKLLNGAKRISIARLYNVQQCSLNSRQQKFSQREAGVLKLFITFKTLKSFKTF